MFLDRLSDVEVFCLIRKYLSVVDAENAKKYFKNGSLLRGDNFVDFVFDRTEFDEGSVFMTDFDADVTFALKQQNQQIKIDHLKFMSNRFGNEYLNAVKCYAEKEMKEDYKKIILENYRNLNFIIEENEKSN